MGVETNAQLFSARRRPSPISLTHRRALNLTAADFLGLGNDPTVQAAARTTVERYGVGSCGPRGFYGTFDVHLQVIARLLVRLWWWRLSQC